MRYNKNNNKYFQFQVPNKKQLQQAFYKSFKQNYIVIYNMYIKT